MPYPNEHACRLRDPGDFQDDSYVRTTRKSKSVGKTYSVIQARLKGKDTLTDQAYRYKKDSWEASEARSHCKRHNGSFEAAEKEKKSQGTRPSFLVDRIVNVPLMVTSAKLHAVLNAIGDRVGLDMEEMGIEFEARKRTKKETDKKIAVIRIHDTLVHRTYGLSALSGLTSYEGIRANFRAALKDDSIETIVLDIDSPGGEVAGVFDLVDEIYQARGKKCIIAVGNEMMYSAAYAIGSAAEKIYIPRTGVAGSIGVIAIHTDRSKMDEKAGVKFTPIYAGAKKTAFSTHEPLSDEALKDAQAKVDEVYGIFADTVARNRGISVKDVKSTEAATYLGEGAIKVGLVDEILSWDQVMETISTKSEGGVVMPSTKELKEKLDALLKDVPLEKRSEALLGLGYVSEETFNTLKAEVENLRTDLGTVTNRSEKVIRKELEGKMTEEYRAKIRKEIEGELSSDGVVEELRNEVEALKTKVADSEKLAEKAEDSRRLMELEAKVRGIGVIGDPKEHAQVIASLEKVDEVLAAKHIKQLEAEAAMLKAAGIFDDLGSGAEGTAGTAYEALKQKVDELKTKKGMDDIAAWRSAPKEFPELYKEYQAERRLTAKGGE